VKTVVRTVLVAAAAFAAGLALAYMMVLLPARTLSADDLARAERAQVAADRRADAFDGALEVMLGTLTNLEEPAHPVVDGVYLARIESVERANITVDWLGIEGRKPGSQIPDPFRAATDRSRFRQTLSPLPLSKVFTVEHETLRQTDDVPAFLQKLRAKDSQGKRLRDAFWIITVWDGSWVQLLQMPPETGIKLTRASS